MTRALLRSTALGAMLTAGLATGAMAASDGPEVRSNNTQAAVIMEAHNDTDITLESLMNDRVMAADDQELGRVINTYRSDRSADPYLIVDRGIAYDAEARFVPVRYDTLVAVDQGTLGSTATMAEFDKAPAYSARSVNLERDTWPDRVDRFWQDKYAGDRRMNITVSEAVNVRPNDLSVQAPGYRTPGAQPSN